MNEAEATAQVDAMVAANAKALAKNKKDYQLLVGVGSLESKLVSKTARRTLENERDRLAREYYGEIDRLMGRTTDGQIALHLHGADESMAAEKTRDCRWRNFPTYGTNQVWTWEGGDAILGMVGSEGEVFCVLRSGDKVTFVIGTWVNLRSVMSQWCGMDTARYVTA